MPRHRPGWWLVKEHPECLLSFESFYLAPHLLPQNSNKWAELLAGGNAVEAMRVAMRKPEEGLPKKMEELAALGDDTTPP